MAEPDFYTQETVARVLNITPRHFRRLVAAGIVPHAAPGQYPLDECIRGYVQHLQRALDDTGKAGAPDARLGVLQERRRGLKLKNDQRAAEVIPYAHADAVLSEMQATMSDEAERLCADELVAELAAADQPALIRARLQEAVRDMRQRVADYFGALGARGRQ